MSRIDPSWVGSLVTIPLLERRWLRQSWQRHGVGLGRYYLPGRASVHDGRNDAVVTLENQVVEVRRGHRPQCRQLCDRLLLVEHIERPVAGGASLQVRVVGGDAVVGADNDRVDPGGSLLRPRQSPDRLDATLATAHACSGHLAGAEQQVHVDLVEWPPCVRVEQRDGRGEEPFLVLTGGGAAGRAVSQVREVAQEFSGVLRARTIDGVFFPQWRPREASA